MYANGLATGIETTTEHPFYTRLGVREWNNDTRRWRHVYREPRWTEAGSLTRTLRETHALATPTDFGEALPVPEVPGRGMAFGADFWWLIGRWLGDGTLRVEQAPAAPRSRHGITIVCGHHEADDLGERLAKIAPAHGVRAGRGELRWQRKAHRTATVFTTSHRDLVLWIAEHFGRHATGKTVPAWALTMPTAWRAALLDGYLSADGNISHTTEFSSVSKRLAFGMRLLATSLGYIANIKGPFTRSPRTIEGRPVTERPTWAVSWITGGPASAHSVTIDGYRWQPVRRIVSTGRTVRVYNLSVAEDESYLADGIMVHNCPPFSNARGERRDFDRDTQDVLFETESEAELRQRESWKRGRLLMYEVPRYLEAMALRGHPVLGGVVENVPDARKWAHWHAWLDRIRKLGYRTRVIALNSVHAAGPRSRRAPQSRNRLYVVYWLASFGRDPDWDKWLRPEAWCPVCEQVVRGVQAFKKPGADMGSYGPQYVFRCPHATCRGAVVCPGVVPAAAVIDWTDLGVRIGDRERPLTAATRARIEAGLRRYAMPVTAEVAGYPFERRPGVRTRPVSAPVTAQTATATKALACPPMLVPAGGTWRDRASSTAEPFPARTARENDGLATAPFITELRNNMTIRPVTEPLSTISTWGAHHGLACPPFVVPLRSGRPRTINPEAEPLATVVADGARQYLAAPGGAVLMRNNTARGDQGQMSTPVSEPARTLTSTGHQSLVSWGSALVPYYSNGTPRPVWEPAGTMTSKDRWALASGPQADPGIDVDDVWFRMLKPGEIAAAMAFRPGYIALGTRTERVAGYGNAVTPPAMEVIVSALVEVFSGEELERAA